MNDTIHQDAEAAARALKTGRVVDYQPGDGTRYECLLFTAVTERWNDSDGTDVLRRTFFAVINQRWTAEAYTGDCRSWVERGLPRGSWMGLRPLLAALDIARGMTTMDKTDQSREFEVRAYTHSRAGTDLDLRERRTNERVGQVVRNLMEAEGYIVQEPD